VWAHSDSWYDIHTDRLCVEEYDSLNFFPIEHKIVEDLRLKLEIGPYVAPVSDLPEPNLPTLE